MIWLLFVLLFIFIFLAILFISLYLQGTSPKEEAVNFSEKYSLKIKKESFEEKKQKDIKRYGADVLLKDGITVKEWYSRKLMFSILFGFFFFLFNKLFINDFLALTTLGGVILGWFIIDLDAYFLNKKSNSEMLPDILEMSRSILYGKKGGQFISDALKDSIIVVRNTRLKNALFHLKVDLNSGMSISDSLDDFESFFYNGEISSFCTIIKSLQQTGQVNDALNSLERNIEREENAINKKRNIVIEQKTSLIVLAIACDLIVLLIYCIADKLLMLASEF